MLAHTVNDVFEFGNDRGCINEDVTIRIPWAAPEATAILGINCGVLNCLCCMLIVVAYRVMEF